MWIQRIGNGRVNTVHNIDKWQPHTMVMLNWKKSQAYLILRWNLTEEKHKLLDTEGNQTSRRWKEIRHSYLISPHYNLHLAISSQRAQIRIWSWFVSGLIQQKKRRWKWCYIPPGFQGLKLPRSSIISNLSKRVVLQCEPLCGINREGTSRMRK